MPCIGSKLRPLISEIILLTRDEGEWDFGLWDALVADSGPAGSKILLKTKVKRFGLE